MTRDPPRRRSRWINTTLALTTLFLAAGCAVNVLQNPFGGMRAPAYLVFWLLATLGLNRAFALLQVVASPGKARGALRVAKWLLPAILPLAALPLIESAVMARQIGIASRILAPVIGFAEVNPSSDALPVVRFPLPVHYGRTDTGFTLWLTAPAVDLDGYNLRYDSTTHGWRHMHNDLPSVIPDSDSLCVLEASDWRCAEALSVAPR